MIALDNDLIVDACYDADIEPDAENAGEGAYLYRMYSGRAMYGDTCFGIVGTPGQTAQFLIALAEEDRMLAVDLAEAMTTDSMGRSMITYFPGYALGDDHEEE